MAQFVEVPLDRIAPDTRTALLEEYASRDGTDYGEQETTLATRVEQLLRQLQCGDLVLLYDVEAETWDILSKENAQEYLQNG